MFDVPAYFYQQKKLYIFLKNTHNYSHDTVLGGKQFPGQQLNKILTLFFPALLLKQIPFSDLRC